MCLIVRCEADKPLNEKLLENMQEKNSDGFGFMWIQDNKLQTFKSHLGDFKPLWDKYQELKEFNPFIHLRWKTHGDIDHTNTHPYPCGHGIWMMHNGIMRVDDTSDKSKSDTWHWLDQLIIPLLDMSTNPHEMIRSPKFRKLVDHQLGVSNRMVFGDRGGFVLFGTDNWYKIEEEETGCKGLLVSNEYAWNEFKFKPKKIVVPSPQQGNWSNHNSVKIIKCEEEVMWQGKKYTQIRHNIYCDEDDIFYYNTGTKMHYNARLNEQYKKILFSEKPQPKQEALDLGIVTNTTATTTPVVYSQGDYTQALVKDWLRRMPHEINGMVYSEPDEAAKVLSYLIKNSAHNV